MKTIYDHRGNPIPLDTLTEELAGSVDYVRPIWSDPVADKIRPAYLARILQAAREGNAHEFLTLADDMEEREMHYSSVLRTRKLAVSGLTPRLVNDPNIDSKITEAVEQIIGSPRFSDLVADLLDAIAKGYSVAEIMWDRSGKHWQPAEYLWRDPRWFRFDMQDREQLKLLTEARPDIGEPLPPYKFIVHYPHLKTGLKISSGLARLAAVGYMCKIYTLKDWMQFLEVFGMPLRIGRYQRGANKEDINTLRRAVINLGTDAAAVIPESMKVEFVKEAVGGQSGDSVFYTFAKWIDSQISKAVLGQTMTADDGSSKAQAEVHNEVREDIRDDDARKLLNTINSQLIEPFIVLNFGPQEHYPRVEFPIEESTDVAAFCDGLAKLIPLGLKVSQPWVRKRLGAPEPEADEELLAPPPADKATVKAANREGLKDLTSEVIFREDELEEIAADELEDWEPMMSEIQGPIEKALKSASSFEDFLEQLKALGDSITPTQFTARLARAAFKARGLGDAQDET